MTRLPFILLLVLLAYVGLECCSQEIMPHSRRYFRTVATTSGSMNPSNLTSLNYWFVAEDMAASKGEGANTIDAWTDRSSNARHLAALSGRNAGYSNNWYSSGRGAVLFLSGADQLTNFTAAYTQPYYQFALVRYVGSDGANGYMISSSNAAGMTWHRSTGNGASYSGTSLDWGNDVPGTWYCIVTYFSGTSSWIRTNRVAAAGGNLGTTIQNGISLSGDQSGANRCNFDLVELWSCSDTLNTNQIQQLEDYLLR